MSSFPLPAFFDCPISFISVLLVVPLLCTEVCHFLHLWQFVPCGPACVPSFQAKTFVFYLTVC